MKRNFLLNFILCIFLINGSLAQTIQSNAIEDFKPSSLNQPGQDYPQVNTQGYARFKIIAPSADSVRVSLGLGGRGGTRLQKVEDGSWAGLSMGGMETKQITMNKPDVFSYYGLLSGGTYAPTDIKDKSKVKLVFLSCGSKEKPDGVKSAATALKDAGYNAVYYISDKTAHEFQTWRRSLHELAPLLFK
jgi:hypothetical protein